MSKVDVTRKLKQLADKAAKERVRSQMEKLDAVVKEDAETLNRIIELAEDGLLYKQVDRQYVCATVEILLEDYTNPTHASAMTKIKKLQPTSSWGRKYRPPYLVIIVGGHQYEYAADIFRRLEADAEDSLAKAKEQVKRLKEYTTELKDIEKRIPFVKEMMLKFQDIEVTNNEY